MKRVYIHELRNSRDCQCLIQVGVIPFTMRKVKQLTLKRRNILNYDEAATIKGGFDTDVDATGGCTDGCGPIFCTCWNCTEETCTNDCTTGPGCSTDPLCTLGCS